MKWSEEKVQQLRTLAFAGKGNKEIARQLGVGINDVYAERSHLGITIDKVKASQAAAAKPSPGAAQPKPTAGERGEARFARLEEFDAKWNLLKLLEPALGKADSSIVALELAEQGKVVKIHYSNGAERRACIECDSLLAMIADVTHKCLY